VTSGRRGVSVVEALVTLLLGLVLAALSLALLARQRSVQVALSDRMELVGTVRTVRHILGSELRGGWSSIDLSLHAPDSLRLRAYRGMARICAVQSWNRVLVTTEGVRLPDPAKDSVLFLTADGGTSPVALVSAEAGDPASCAPTAGRAWILEVSDSVPPGTMLARYFERGSYHLSGRALRYRRGLSGRQPLTPEALRTPASAFTLGSGGGVEVVLESKRMPVFTWSLSLPGAVR
jgi:hypothetical protein